MLPLALLLPPLAPVQAGEDLPVLVPRPLVLERAGPPLLLSPDAEVRYRDDGLRGLAHVLADDLAELTKCAWKATPKPARAGDVELALGPLPGEVACRDEAFVVEVAEHATILAETTDGAARGAARLLQLVHRVPGSWALDGVRVVDGPERAWRGYALRDRDGRIVEDSAREALRLGHLAGANLLALSTDATEGDLELFRRLAREADARSIELFAWIDPSRLEVPGPEDPDVVAREVAEALAGAVQGVVVESKRPGEHCVRLVARLWRAGFRVVIDERYVRGYSAYGAEARLRSPSGEHTPLEATLVENGDTDRVLGGMCVLDVDESGRRVAALWETAARDANAFWRGRSAGVGPGVIDAPDRFRHVVARIVVGERAAPRDGETPTLVPRPLSLAVVGPPLRLREDAQVRFSDDSLAALAGVLADDLEPLTRRRWSVVRGEGRPGDVSLVRGALPEAVAGRGEAFAVEVDERATITAEAPDGAARGAARLLQLVHRVPGSWALQGVRLVDAPERSLRGLGLVRGRGLDDPSMLRDAVRLAHLSGGNVVVASMPGSDELHDEVRALRVEASARGVSFLPWIHGSSALDGGGDVRAAADDVVRGLRELLPGATRFVVELADLRRPHVARRDALREACRRQGIEPILAGRWAAGSSPDGRTATRLRFGSRRGWLVHGHVVEQRRADAHSESPPLGRLSVANPLFAGRRLGLFRDTLARDAEIAWRGSDEHAAAPGLDETPERLRNVVARVLAR